MIGTAMSIFSYPGMCISISANSQVSAAMRRPAGLKGSEFSAALGECRVKAISSFTIAEMGHSRKCQRKREWNRSVLFKLVGTKSNKMAIGAKLTVNAGKMVQTAEVHAGGSYLSSNDPRLHFGLASESR